MRLVAVALSYLLTLASSAQAEPVPQALDLTLPRRGVLVDPPLAHTLRTTGVGLTLAGLAVTLAGTLVQTFDPIPQSPALGSGFVFGGGVAFGAGMSLWAIGARELQHPDGSGPALASAPRARRARKMKVGGAVLTGLGGALVLGSIVPIAMTTCTRHDEDCALFLAFNSGIPAGLGSVLLGAGVPLLTIGLGDERAGKTRLTVDTVGPRAMPGGGGIGVSGRF